MIFSCEWQLKHCRQFVTQSLSQFCQNLTCAFAIRGFQTLFWYGISYLSCQPSNYPTETKHTAGRRHLLLLPLGFVFPPDCHLLPAPAGRGSLARLWLWDRLSEGSFEEMSNWKRIKCFIKKFIILERKTSLLLLPAGDTFDTAAECVTSHLAKGRRPTKKVPQRKFFPFFCDPSLPVMADLSEIML